MTGSYSKAYHLSLISLKVKRQLNFTPRWTEVRSLVWKQGTTHRHNDEVFHSPVSHHNRKLLKKQSYRRAYKFWTKFFALTCSTAFISRRSSVGFQRPRSLVIFKGCLVFFTLLGRGEGFNITARGGVRAVPDFVTLKKKRKILQHVNLFHSFNYALLTI